jgi:hypothetical protein
MERGIWKDGRLVRSLGGGPVAPPAAANRGGARAQHGEARPEAAVPGARVRGCLRGDCTSGRGVRSYPNGSNYDGQFQNAVRHGRGRHFWPDGSSYDGSWVADRRHGHGVQTYRDGRYEGTWYKGVPTAEGVRIWNNGNRYQGEYRDDRSSGHGTLSLANGDRYVGEFRAGQPHGVGSWQHASGSLRAGRWSRGRYMGAESVAPHAAGSSGLIAGGSGCIAGDCWSGRGRYRYADSSEYVGRFRSGQPHGRGSLTHPDGRIDSGIWDNGERVGRRVIAAPGAVAKWRAQAKPRDGCTAGDCRSGHGAYRWPDGSTYVGEFENSRPHGHGSWQRPDGERYVGGWQHGNRHGKGTLTSANGKVHGGTWTNGHLVGTGSRSVARLRLPWPDLSRPARRSGGGEHDAAVVVGIERYAHVPRIVGASDNATYWYDYFVRSRGVPLQHVSLLLDNDATLEDIEWSVDEAAGQVSESGTLWFVFVGHGAPSRDGSDGLLVGFDAQRKARSIEARSMRRSQLLARLAASRASQIQVLLDAGFSGRATNGEPLVAGLQPLVVTSPDASADPRTTLLTAARDDEYAGLLPGANRPAFSYLALGAIRGWADVNEDGSVTAVELRDYVDRALRLLVVDRRQRSTLFGASQALLARGARERGPELSSLARGLAMSFPGGSRR